jgi:hypothetical protein
MLVHVLLEPCPQLVWSLRLAILKDVVGDLLSHGWVEQHALWLSSYPVYDTRKNLRIIRSGVWDLVHNLLESFKQGG